MPTDAPPRRSAQSARSGKTERESAGARTSTSSTDPRQRPKSPDLCQLVPPMPEEQRLRRRSKPSGDVGNAEKILTPHIKHRPPKIS
jgi:hypothetical protein